MTLTNTAVVVATLLALGHAGSALAHEAQSVVSAPVSFETAWGYAVRYGLRDRLATQRQQSDFKEAVTLVEANRDLGLVVIEVQREGTYRLTAHLVDVGSCGGAAPRCTSVMILGEG